ncbi:hypothetical protein RSJ19_11040 [Clostridium botulinum]|uniref:MltR family transcriptional regulator n=1 Tax=Clostridium botulinum TaxID=1491 RepID=UPI000774A063|nr:MltR family transcriptional regulator [Clostridium botulinum]AUN03425.1 hypothetical protein RSJ19_11040 [Clostridium botulinum]NFB58004.1 DUF4145 domain-containing protein [Clostridium botulinum]NFB61744.1 DUF4145 domain-containing protein [Clostridium botulinum]
MSKCGATNLLNIFLKEFKNESDRACVILSAAMIENELESLLKKKLVSSSKKTDNLFDNATSALGTFSSKIDMAYRLGLISKNLCRDIHIIRKIRNQFAHDIYDCNFNNTVIIDKVKELESSTQIVKQDLEFRDKFDGSTRGDFQMICAKIIFYLKSGRLNSSIITCIEKDKEWIYGNESHSNIES